MGGAGGFEGENLLFVCLGWCERYPDFILDAVGEKDYRGHRPFLLRWIRRNLDATKTGDASSIPRNRYWDRPGVERKREEIKTYPLQPQRSLRIRKQPQRPLVRQSLHNRHNPSKVVHHNLTRAPIPDHPIPRRPQILPVQITYAFRHHILCNHIDCERPVRVTQIHGHPGTALLGQEIAELGQFADNDVLGFVDAVRGEEGVQGGAAHAVEIAGAGAEAGGVVFGPGVFVEL